MALTVHRNDEGAPPSAPGPARAPLWHRAVAGTLKAVLPLVFVAAAVWGWQRIGATAPPPEQAARTPEPRLVDVVAARPALSGPRVVAHGRVVPARALSLAPDAAGRVVEVHPALERHGRLDAGSVAFSLDTRSLELDLAEAEARVAQIEARIMTERGQAERARRDFERLPLDDITEEQAALILREPQRAELEAERAAARAAVGRARLALDEAVVRAPFDAVVLSAAVAPGTRLAAGEEAARLAATDRFRVALPVALPALAWIEEGRAVRLAKPGVWPGDTARVGRIERGGAELAGGGSLAEVIVSLDRPLDAEPPVRLGAFLRATIEAPAVEGAVALDRGHLRDGDRVWVMDEADRLDIREVDVLWRGPERVLVEAGLAPGERIVTTILDTRVEGMALRARGAATAAGTDESARADGEAG
ncbi:MAG: efflux RND transporter periplasmic adaptor subunit [Paracoccaceae bacterium]